MSDQTGTCTQPGLWHVSVFINGCLSDYDAWHDSEADAMHDAEDWQYHGDNGPAPMAWNTGQCMYGPGTTIHKGYYPDSLYMVEVIHYPTFALCGCDAWDLDIEHGIYDTANAEWCDDCEDKMQNAIDAEERNQP